MNKGSSSSAEQTKGAHGVVLRWLWRPLRLAGPYLCQLFVQRGMALPIDSGHSVANNSGGGGFCYEHPLACTALLNGP